MNSHIRMRRHARLMLGCCLGIAFLASGLPPETSMAEDTKGCPRWISVMPLAEDDVDGVASDAVAQGDETIVDGIAWITRLCPEGKPAADIAAQYAAAYRKIEPKVRSRSRMKQGVLLQSTMGHGGYPGEISGYQVAVKPDGTSVYRMCPLDSRFPDACRAQAGLLHGG